MSKQPKKRGPKPGPPQLVRKQRGVRVNDVDWARIKAAAEAEGVSVSDWVLAAALEKLDT